MPTQALSTAVDFESVPCPVCGKDQPVERYSYSDRFGRYAIVTCGACGFNYLSPRPSESTIGPYYDSEAYTPFLSSAEPKSLFSKVYTIARTYSVQWKRRGIEKRVVRGKLLDVGCGTGEFLFAMKTGGWAVKGIEPSAAASEYARSKLALDVLTGFPDAASLSRTGGTFDCITLWHVLEHIHQPTEVLNRLRGLLTDEGLLVIAVPNINSWDAVFYGKTWVALDPPRHLHHFTYDSLSRLLGISGMRVIDSLQMPLDAAFDCLMSERSLMHDRSVLLKIVYTIRFVLMTLLTWIAGLNSKRGSAVVYYIKKNTNA